MNHRKPFREQLPFWGLLSLPVLFLALLMAEAYEDGMNLVELMGSFS